MGRNLDRDIDTFRHLMVIVRPHASEWLNAKPSKAAVDQLATGIKLVHEEVNEELLPSLRELQLINIMPNHYTDAERKVIVGKVLTEILDGAIDSVYVIIGALHDAGLGGLFQAAWNEVQKSNEAKAVNTPDGKQRIIKKNKEGKVMKPEGWEKPKLDVLVKAKLDTTLIWKA